MNNQISTVELATNFRAKFQIGIYDSLNLPQLLHTIDVITVFKPLSLGFSGLSQITEGKKFMLINSKHSLARQNFTICHELYHLFYQENFNAMICSTGTFDKKDPEEYRADCFAADLLLPKFGLMKEIPSEEARFNSISIQTLLKIEHKFRCSRSALLYRLKKMNFIDSSYYESYSKNVKRSAAEHGYTDHLYSPTNQELQVIGDYGDKAKAKYDQNLISESHYISLIQDIGIDLDAILDDDVE